MKRLAFAAAAALAVVGQPARADGAATNLVKLFTDVCIGKFGHLTSVWDWADSQEADDHDPQALAVFAGKPNKDGKLTSFAGGLPVPARPRRCPNPLGDLSWRRG